MNNFIKAAIGAGAAAAATGAAIGISKLKKNNFCPKCYIKKLQAAKNYNLPDSALYNNSAALTPPMGWSSWNAFRQNIDENLIYDMALVMKESGLLDAGYKYVNLDDCWHSSMRDENGKLQGDLAKFPSGIKALCEKVNSLGLKLGIYTSNGTLTCEDLPASLGKEAIDADTFAQWGIEFFKYDFCHNVPISGEGPDLDRIYIAPAGSSDEQIIEAETGRLTGTATRGNKVNYGDFGLVALEPAWITSNQIEAARIAMTRYIKRGGKVWIKIFPDKPITEKPAETRMGSGKGSPEYWVAVVKPGRVMFEIAGVDEALAREAMRLAANKLPIKCKFVTKEETGGEQ